MSGEKRAESIVVVMSPDYLKNHITI